MVMRGDCGFFVAGGKPVGGFFGWNLNPRVARTGLEQNNAVYKILRWSGGLADWWLEADGLVTVRAVFCRVLKGRLTPLFGAELEVGPYAAGKRNKELIIEKEIFQ